jgi:predicted NUDIX family NTP pyrophosphohydrolase
MASKKSAGLLIHRRRGEVEVFLVHPGGPFWAKRDLGAWSIPKGELDDDEDPLEAARRELVEETGFRIAGEFRALSPVRQPGGKLVLAWMIEADLDPTRLRSGTFSMEWPPKSGQMREFPEVDRAAWFTLPEARQRILRGQLGLLDQLAAALGVTETGRGG